MSEPIAEKPLPQTSAQQQKYLASLSAKELERITLVLDGKTVQFMRDILRSLQAGARLQTSERRTVAWNATTGAFEHVCERCGTAGFIVERLRGEGALERHAWCCDGEPAGPGWQLAEVRRLPFAFDVESAAACLSSTDPDAQDEPGDAWVPTAYPCRCGAGQIEVRLLVPGSRWQCWCVACGSSSAQ